MNSRRFIAGHPPMLPAERKRFYGEGPNRRMSARGQNGSGLPSGAGIARPTRHIRKVPTAMQRSKMHLHSIRGQMVASSPSDSQEDNTAFVGVGRSVIC